MIDKAIKALGVDEFVIDGNPSNEAEFLAMFKKVVGEDADGVAIISSDPQDFGVTWQQIQEIMPTVLADFKMEMLRAERNERLAASDWSQSPDIPEATRILWQPYRQALRDVPQNYTSLDDVIWPTKPE
jgi:hypothetical protein